MGEFEARFGHWVIRFRYLIICLSICLLALGFAGAKQLHFTTDYRIYFSEDNPELLAFEAMENTFSKNDNVLFALAPKNGDIFTRENLTIIKELTEQAWQTPYSNRVESVTNYQHTESTEDDMTIADLVLEPEALSDSELSKIRTIAVNQPLIVHRLTSKSGHVAGINITVQMPGLDEDKETPEVVEYVRKLASDIETNHPDMKVYLTGMVMMNNAFSESSKNDIMSIVPLSFAVMLILLALMVGGITGTVCSLLVIAFSIIVAMGTGAALGFPLSPPSASAPTIILTVAIANCVHILTTMNHELAERHDKHAAIIESLRVNIQPITIACLTTTIGFLGMNFSDVPPFRHLGNFVAIGVMVSLVLSVAFLPALLSLLPVNAPNKSKQKITRVEKIGRFVVRKHNVLFWAVAVCILILVASIPRNQLNDIFLHYFDDSVQFRTDSDFITENLTGLYTIEYTMDAGEISGINSPEFLNDVENFANWIRQRPEVVNVISITDVMKRLNKNLHGDDPNAYHLPQERGLAAQYLLLYENSLPYGLDLNNQVNIDKSSTLMFVRTKTISSQELIDLDQSAHNWLANNTQHISKTTSSGTSLMFANIGQRNIKSMLFGTTVALVVISLILVIALRSIKIGLVSLVPNLVPAAMGFGLWGLMVGEIGLSLSVVTTMTLGIVVDDTVHMLSKYLRARREYGMQAKGAVRYAFKTVGKALFTTSVVLAAGFFLLATSSFELNAGMGLLTGIVIIFALVADFFFLPPLLIKLEKENEVTMGVPSGTTDTP